MPGRSSRGSRPAGPTSGPRRRRSRVRRPGRLIAVPASDTDEEALSIANDTDYRQAATVRSRGIDQALTSARYFRAGTVADYGPDTEHASSLPRPDRDSDAEDP
ncbi:aldehyde dehydrogenase family protein [Streptomyces phaeochromogenes]|uniref:aldehyde dehydrogenase family protein n=1 Tax=Streptomyces phaeochromogenes TaxID=1923 RepID=UPI003693F587